LRAVGAGFGPDGASWSFAASCALALARLTSLRIILKLFVVEKQLLAGSEDEVLRAISAFQNTIDILHGTSLRLAPWHEAHARRKVRRVERLQLAD
jgi:hypothetical protein